MSGKLTVHTLENKTSTKLVKTKDGELELMIVNGRKGVRKKVKCDLTDIEETRSLLTRIFNVLDDGEWITLQ